MQLPFLKVLPIVPQNKISARLFNKCLDLGLMIHTQCNLACSFCCLKPNMGDSYSVERFNDYLQRTERLLDQASLNLTECNIQLQGGELFMDKMSDKFFVDLSDFFIQTARPFA